jgi:hypothetical protein
MQYLRDFELCPLSSIQENERIKNIKQTLETPAVEVSYF